MIIFRFFWLILAFVFGILAYSGATEYSHYLWFMCIILICLSLRSWKDHARKQQRAFELEQTYEWK
jgi:cobalamin biosynthesis protein CobD/CbiB